MVDAREVVAAQNSLVGGVISGLATSAERQRPSELVGERVFVVPVGIWTFSEHQWIGILRCRRPLALEAHVHPYLAVGLLPWLAVAVFPWLALVSEGSQVTADPRLSERKVPNLVDVQVVHLRSRNQAFRHSPDGTTRTNELTDDEAPVGNVHPPTDLCAQVLGSEPDGLPIFGTLTGCTKGRHWLSHGASRLVNMTLSIKAPESDERVN